MLACAAGPAAAWCGRGEGWWLTVQAERDGELGVAPETGEERRGEEVVVVYFVSLGEGREVQSSATFATARGSSQGDVACQMKGEGDEHEQGKKAKGSHNVVCWSTSQCVKRE